jgi:cobyrinic acid a,c-diamide synthase
MIYLSRQVTTADGTAHSMAGVLPFAAEMTSRLVDFGYVTVEVTNNCLIGPGGTVVRGHSFHYSRIVGLPELKTNYRVRYSLSGREECEGYSIGNVLASYVHLHFRSNSSMARHLIDAARAVRAANVVRA